MTFEIFHQQAWSDHASQAETVAARLSEGLPLLVMPEQVALLARLATHVEGEHLGRWSRGLAFLHALRAHAAPPLLDQAAEGALDRYERSLRFCSGVESALEALSPSVRIRVLAVAAPALAGQGQVARGTELLEEAAAAVQFLDKSDPAHCDLAVAGNNLALALEEKPGRTPEQTALMLKAARLGRREWEIAGGPLQAMRAEYRLAISHVQAGLAAEAVRHAETALELAHTHAAGDCDVFFLFEALALAERASGRLEAFAKAVDLAKERFSRLSGDDRDWCQPVLKNLIDLV